MVGRTGSGWGVASCLTNEDIYSLTWVQQVFGELSETWPVKKQDETALAIHCECVFTSTVFWLAE